MGDVFNVVITTIQSLNRSQMQGRKLVNNGGCVWCARVWCGLHVAWMFFLRGKTSKAIF